MRGRSNALMPSGDLPCEGPSSLFCACSFIRCSTFAEVTNVTDRVPSRRCRRPRLRRERAVRKADRPHRVCARSRRSAQPPHRRSRTRAAGRGWPRAFLVRSRTSCARLIRRRATACCSSRSPTAATRDARPFQSRRRPKRRSVHAGGLRRRVPDEGRLHARLRSDGSSACPRRSSASTRRR